MSIPKATHAGELNIGSIAIECAVLEDGTRVLTQSSFLRAISQSHKPAGQRIGFERIAPFLASNNLKPFINKELSSSNTKIRFKPPRGGPAVGYKAELLPQVCEVYLKARDAGVLIASQMRTAAACEILIRGLAHVGIIALVDEATGYQSIRHRRALQKIIEKYISQELRSWAKIFPNEFYSEIYRLQGWDGPEGSKRYPVIGRYTNNLIYERLAPGVLAELKRKNPTMPTGGRKNRHHQWLTNDFGQPRLRDHLLKVITLMRASPNWTVFLRLLERALPKEGDQLRLGIDPEK